MLDTMNQSSTMAREPVYVEINKCYDLVGTEIIFYFSAVHWSVPSQTDLPSCHYLNVINTINVNHFMLIMSSKLKELVVNNTPSVVHLDFAHVSASPACFSGPLQQLNFIRKSIDGKLHILNVYVDMENNVCPKNRWTWAFTFCLKYLLSSLWCAKAGRCCCRADTAAHPSAGVVGWNQCWVVVDAQL